MIRRSLPYIAAGTFALSGCSEMQSALAPAGDEARRVALLTWILFAGAAMILLIVGIALYLGIRGSERSRRVLGSDKAIKLGGIAFPVVTLTVLLGYGVWLMRGTIATDQPGTLRIEVTGEQWWWRVAYAGRNGTAIAEANELRIPVGREIDVVLRSADVIHSFWVPSLGGKLDMIPGRTNTLRLKAERPGIYRGQCAEYCGGPHALMAMEIVALPDGEFEAWLAAGAATPTGDRHERGRALFESAGCGACHTVRGTQASGVVGPDLSRVGARRFLAAATVPNTPENLARFIASGQAIKPGNLMPEFKIFSDDELGALVMYLVSLK
ncbi:cytochrome c oxidase subunit II [Bosea lathyri]|uniref:Cytochrome aa3 subunit 2 n=1 Tax=Bosea lathyri TaxID=1036778 RepID=A0A1H5XHL4_9HYPH|nr:cytochrome c oxidase subunit II [Bosea lathyri]SEG10955.1 cytochrome c oxidase subunit 2 [Bosea lathyri]